MESEDGCAWPLFPLDESGVKEFVRGCWVRFNMKPAPPCCGVGNCTVGINGRHGNLHAATTNTTWLMSCHELCLLQICNVDRLSIDSYKNPYDGDEDV